MLAKKALYSTLAILLLVFTSNVFAEDLPDIAKRQLKTDDGYMIYYNAIITDTLTSTVAKAYGVTRSKNRVMLTISIRKGGNIMQTKAVRAKVTAQAVNLSSQLKELKLRLIEEGSGDSKGIYYVDDFKFTNQETFNFTIKVMPEHKGKEYEIKFKQQFFVG